MNLEEDPIVKKKPSKQMIKQLAKLVVKANVKIILRDRELRNLGAEKSKQTNPD